MPNHSHPLIRTRDETPARTPPRIVIPVDSSPTRTPVPLPVLSDVVTQVASKPVVELQAIVEPQVEPLIDIPSTITAIIVNFKTEHLIETALSTLTSHYPTLPIILVDNGSNDSSTHYVARAAKKLRTVMSLLLDNNIGHGPALNTAIQSVTTPYIFIMDSDCEVLKGGFLELMFRHFQSDPNLYATGWLRIVDKQTGVPSDKKSGKGKRLMEYIHPHAMLLDREKYLKLTPFQHSGAPATDNMLSAHKAGYKLLSFPIERYVHHLVAGTRRMYGGRWNPRADEKPGAWDKGESLPI